MPKKVQIQDSTMTQLWKEGLKSKKPQPGAAYRKEPASDSGNYNSGHSDHLADEFEELVIQEKTEVDPNVRADLRARIETLEDQYDLGDDRFVPTDYYDDEV